MEMVPLVGSVTTGFGVNAPQAPVYAENEKGLKEASTDFISILFSYMFQNMRGNPDDNEEGSFFGGEHVDMFLSYLDQEVGKKFAEQGGADLVNALYHQLKGDTVIGNENPSSLKNIDTTAIKFNEKNE